ncbi:MAG: TIGR00730 family Rossman fold protein [Acidobacteriota bacterium]|jgi:uncharacterized protein (TIGR00730 family)|nr:TIGR00730 family Rossman fold protein [Acidobacteriota bacterium]
MKRVCVYCGSSPGARGEYADAARSLGRALAAQGLELVYGGADVGLMGVLADAALNAGGRVVGVIPESFADRVSHRGLSELRVVGTMHERKRTMFDLADAFVALPGGFGTLEELSELLTWAQIGLHQKPCGLLNVAGYYDTLLRFLDHATAEGFMKPRHRAMLLVASGAEELLAQFQGYVPPSADKWEE